MSPAPLLRWYLIHTKPSSEAVAQANLQRQGYEVYLPRVAQPARRRGQWCERVGPLFPRYLFLRLLEGRQALGPVRSSVGVADIVRFGSRFGVVPDSVIRELQARTDPVSGLHRLVKSLRLQHGAPVRITLGPFDGLEGVFEREDGAERAVVLLNFLGRDTAVHVSPQYVAPCRAA